MRTSQRRVSKRGAAPFHVVGRVMCQFTPIQPRKVVQALRDAGELALAGYVARRTVV